MGEVVGVVSVGAVLMAIRLVMGQAVNRVPSRVLLLARVVVMRMLVWLRVALAGDLSRAQ